MTLNKKQKGLTLVELMIALALGLFLSGAAIMMFVSNKETALLQEQFARLQESGRFALDRMVKGIRSVGYNGNCAKEAPQTWSILDTGTIEVPFFDLAIAGLNASNDCSTLDTSKLPGEWCSGGLWGGQSLASIADAVELNSVANKPIPGTDIIHIQNSVSCSGNVSSPSLNSANLKAAPAECLKKCKIATVTDCEVAVTFLMTEVNISSAKQAVVVHNSGTNPQCDHDIENDGIPTPGALGYDFEDGEIIIENNLTYYIAQSQYSSRPSLWVHDGSAQELVEGIMDMQVEYLVKGANDFVDADGVSNWDNVTAVRLNLLAETTRDNLLDSFQEYNFYNWSTDVISQVEAKDKRLRKPFVSTVVIRNRAL